MGNVTLKHIAVHVHEIARPNLPRTNIKCMIKLIQQEASKQASNPARNRQQACFLLPGQAYLFLGLHMTQCESYGIEQMCEINQHRHVKHTCEYMRKCNTKYVNVSNMGREPNATYIGSSYEHNVRTTRTNTADAQFANLEDTM